MKSNFRNLSVAQSPDEPRCGACVYCVQTYSGLYRYCFYQRENVFALESLCDRFVSVWSKDLFGEYLYTSVLARQKEVQKKKYKCF